MPKMNYLSKLIYKTDYCFIPYFCNCGCKNIVVLNPNSLKRYERKGYPKFIHGHAVRCQSVETRLKKSKSLLGIPKSKESIEKMKINMPDMSGNKNAFFGHKHKPKSIEKIRKSHIGKHYSFKTCEKHRQRMLGSKNHRYGKPAAKNSGKGIRTHYQSPLQGQVCFRSSYELAYAQYLDQNKILWMYEMETFPLSNEMTYTPDFFLPKENKFVEIKGWMSEKAQIKINKFQEEYPWDLKIIFKKDLKNLNIKIK